MGKKVQVVVDYNNFFLAPELLDTYIATYIAAVRDLAERYHAGVTRYTTSAFIRLKLGDMLASRGVAPRIHESRQEALNWLNR